MWIESDLLGENTTYHVMAGKDYEKAKGTLTHKITIQAMWQLLLSQLMIFKNTTMAWGGVSWVLRTQIQQPGMMSLPQS